MSPVGPPSDEYRAVCVYMPDLGDPHCGAPATLHILVDEDPGYGVVSLAACDRHASDARAAGRFLAEHPFVGFCGFPATLWTAERCVIDDSGVKAECQGELLEVSGA